MNKKNNHNSIIFLTTLSVYLGLVLVGGANAPVLAHSALTRDFDIKNEIVFEDDLDKKPDDELAKDIEKVENFKIAEALIEFFANLKEQEQLGRIESINDLTLAYKTELEEFGKTNISIKETNTVADWFDELIANIISTSQSDDVRSISDWLINSENNNSRKTSVEIKLDQTEFLLTFTFNKKSSKIAEIKSRSFQEVFVNKKVKSKNSAEGLIYDNVNVISENNQIFIVTRLPRASIDALLA